MPDPRQRPAPGDVLALGDEHYRFGVGPLVCRVLAVVGAVRLGGELWWHLRGRCAAGTLDGCGGWLNRELYVASRAMPAARRPARRADEPPAAGTAHLPTRPHWSCVRDGRPWPCPTARAELAAEYAGNRVSLSLYLGAHLVDAIDDAVTHGRPAPAGLHTRFLGWL